VTIEEISNLFSLGKNPKESVHFFENKIQKNPKKSKNLLNDSSLVLELSFE